MLRTGRICSDVRQVDVGLLAGRQLDLGLFSRFFQTLQRQRIIVQINAVLFLELVCQVVDQTHVEIFTTQEGITIGGQHFELMLTVHFGNFDHGDVEGTATQVVHNDGGVATRLVHTVGQSSRGRLVDDALDFQTGDATSILGSLTLTVVEVGRNGDNRFGNRLTKVILGGLLHFLQYFSRHLRRSHFLVIYLNPGVAIVGLDDLVRHQLDVFLNDVFFKATTDQTLDRVQGILRVGNRLTLGRLANQGFTVVGVGDDRRSGTTTLSVLDHLGGTVFQNRDTGVGGPQVDTDNLAHKFLSESDCRVLVSGAVQLCLSP